MDRRIVESKARSLQHRLSERDPVRFGGVSGRSAIPNPERAAELHGLRIELVGVIPDAQGLRLAGYLDRKAKLIRISSEFRADVRRFTLAHEIGHYQLHRNEVEFRDRPMPSGRNTERFPIEQEADYFAACFLMPEDILRERFESTFMVETPFLFDESWAFHLGLQEDFDSLSSERDALDARAFALARAHAFRGRRIVPLHEQFEVSESAMAYRLMEFHCFCRARDAKPFFVEDTDSGSAMPLFGLGFHRIREADLESLFVDPFPKSARRIDLVEGLQRFLNFVREIGIGCEIWLDGSLTTKKLEPNDVDLVVFYQGSDLDRLSPDRYAKLSQLNDRDAMKERYGCDVYHDRSEDLQARQRWQRTYAQGRALTSAGKGIPVLTIERP